MCRATKCRRGLRRERPYKGEAAVAAGLSMNHEPDLIAPLPPLPAALLLQRAFLVASCLALVLLGVGYLGKRLLYADGEAGGPGVAATRRAAARTLIAGLLAAYVTVPAALWPSSGAGHPSVWAAGLASAVASLLALALLWREQATPARRSGLPHAVALIWMGAFCGALSAQMPRGIALAEEQAAEDRRQAEAQAEAASQDGKGLFGSYCSGCHGVDRQIVGPPLTEIARIYAGNPGGIVTWARAPGRKRPGLPPMPPFAAVDEARLTRIAEFMLETGARAAP